VTARASSEGLSDQMPSISVAFPVKAIRVMVRGGISEAPLVSDSRRCGGRRWRIPPTANDQRPTNRTSIFLRMGRMNIPGDLEVRLDGFTASAGQDVMVSPIPACPV